MKSKETRKSEEVCSQRCVEVCRGLAGDMGGE